MEEYIRNKTAEIAKYILDIILINPVTPMSWGLKDPIPCYSESLSMPGLQIHVQGFKYTGNVQILLNQGSDTFEVRLTDNSGDILSTTKDVYLSDLVSVIDNLVEKTEDYENRISQAYGSIVVIPEEDS